MNNQESKQDEDKLVTTGARTKLHRIVEELQNLIQDGRLHLLAWQQILEATKKYPELLDLATGFFVLTAKAHREATILCAAKLVEGQGDSVTFDYFFNVLLGSNSYFLANWDEVKRSAQADKKRLPEIRQAFEKVRVERDKVVAHLDKEIINSGSKSQIYVSFTELSELFDVFEHLLNPYYAYCSFLAPADLRNADDIFSMRLDDLFYLVGRALDSETIDDASENIKRAHSWRKALLEVARMEDELRNTGTYSFHNKKKTI